MSENVFIPKMNQESAGTRAAAVVVEQTKEDETSAVLLKVAQYAVIALFGLTPIFFMPGLWASLGFSKVLLAIGLGVVTIVAVSLLALRRSETKTVLPISLGLFWLLVMVAMVAGLHSGDVSDSMRGSIFETQTVGFLAVLGLVMTIPLVLQNSKIMSIKALAFFGFIAAILLTYNVLRVLLGGDFLTLGSFGSVTVSPIGGFNDLAIFAGLVVVLGLVTLAQLPLKTWLQGVLAGVIGLALVLLAVVNFFNIWIVIGFFSLLLFVYLLSRDTLFRGVKQAVENTKILVGMTAIVCIISAIFIIAGDYVGGKISSWTNVNYIEVRPSLEATVDIARNTYSDSLFFGVGPNRFIDAWRQYKDPAINATIFWDTDFQSGSGYVPTLFVTTGLLGGLLMVFFHALFLYVGYRMLLRSVEQDSYWYYFGVVSFAAACFIWGMSYVYVPGAALLLLAAIFTGFTFVAAGALLPYTVKTISMASNQRRGFFLMATIILIITVSVGTLFSVGKQYVAEADFAKAQVQSESVAEFEQSAFAAYNLYQDDRFLSARAQIHLASLTALLNVTNPTQEQQQQFLASAEQAIQFAQQAVDGDITNPDYHAILAGVYSNLALASIEGAKERSALSLAEAQRLDPRNPGYHLIAAQIAARAGEIEEARTSISDALALKRNFTEALYLSAQLDISEGKTESAIATTRAIITLEPNNPTRYFQLGVLLSANQQHAAAIQAYSAAVQLDAAYANARYMAALSLLNLEQPEQALEQLKIVQQTNADNIELQALIAQVENGEYEVPENTAYEAPVTEAVPIEGFDDTVITDGITETDLVQPVNTVSESDETVELGLPEEIMETSINSEETPSEEVEVTTEE